MNGRECSAYRRGQICENGFPTNAACMGFVCHSCGRPTDKTPPCLNEDLPLRWFDESGLPIFSQVRTSSSNGGGVERKTV